MSRLSLRAALASTVALIGAWLGLTAPAGAATVTSAEYGFAFSLPPKWTEIPLNSSDIGAIISAATRGDPALKNVLSQQVLQASKKGLKIFAVGPVSGGFLPNLNIGVDSAVGAPTGTQFLNAMAVEAKIFLGEAGAKQVKVAPVHTPLGGAVQASYQLHLSVSGHALAVYGLQFYLEHGARLYVITFSSAALAQDFGVAHVVESSWRWR